MKNMRFGGISPVVLRELSGVYQPFVKAVKEIISNSYDADASTVQLSFLDDFRKLVIRDDGSGMNPIDFVRDYIRIGKSHRKNDFTPIKQRPRIGGKGIGFLAPARYCDVLEVRTKKSGISHGRLTVEVHGDHVDMTPYLLQGHGEDSILNHIQIGKVYGSDEQEIAPVSVSGFELSFERPIDEFCTVEYTFDSSNLVLTAKIHFALLFDLDPSKSLEDIENFCRVKIEPTYDICEMDSSYSEITLHGLKEFVRKELSAKGKKGARNVESGSGFDQFLWNLSRIIPIAADLHENLPDSLRDFVRSEMDGEDNGYPVNVLCSVNGDKARTLGRAVIQPGWKMDMTYDADLVKFLSVDVEDAGFQVHGFLIGQPSTIYPAECRGILLRVKGVAIEEPTYFDLDQTLTGAARVALSQISGEINIVSGIDPIHDINPGRDGFYKESESYNFLKNKVVPMLEELVKAILTRSEVNASLQNFLKKNEAHRKAILEIALTLSRMAMDNDEILSRFEHSTDSIHLALTPAVQYKAEGKLAVYTVKLVSDIQGKYKVDYVKKELLLNEADDMWRRNIWIGMTDFKIVYKHGKKSEKVCEVNSKGKMILVNWDHPMRGTLGDTGFLKHCFATIASAIPPEQLETYIELITARE